MSDAGVMPWSMERRCGDKGRKKGGEKLSSRRRMEGCQRKEGLGERRLPTWHHPDHRRLFVEMDISSSDWTGVSDCVSLFSALVRDLNFST